MSTRLGALVPAMVLSGFVLWACGSDGDTSGLSVQVFADWNGNGVFDTAEEHGVLAVEIEVAGVGKAETDDSGIARFEAAPGSYSPTISRMPPNWRTTAAPSVPVQVTASGDARAEFGIRPDVPASRIPYKIALTGDSISSGFSQKPPPEIDYVVDGFDRPLRTHLERSFGKIAVANRALPGTKSPCGAAMVGTRLSGAVGLFDCTCVPPNPRPGDPRAGQPEAPETQDTAPFGAAAYLVILYGTNDLNDPGSCITPNCTVEFGGCRTVSQLQSMLQSARAVGAIPVLSTVPPGFKQHGCTPAWNQNFNEAVGALNAEIRTLAEQTDTVLIDYWKAFKSSKSPPMEELISDIEVWTLPNGQRRCGPGLHPTRRGYDLMAEAAYLAITGQPSPYEDTPVPQFKPLVEALADYRDFLDRTGFRPDPLPQLK